MYDVWPPPGLVHYIYIFAGFCPLTEFCQAQNSRYVQVLHSPILQALLHGTPAAGISQILRHGTMNGISELLQRAPPIFGWAAITLGIGPHSISICISILNIQIFHFEPNPYQEQKLKCMPITAVNYYSPLSTRHACVFLSQHCVKPCITCAVSALDGACHCFCTNYYFCFMAIIEDNLA